MGAKGACVLVLSWVLWGPVFKHWHGCYGGLCSSIAMGVVLYSIKIKSQGQNMLQGEKKISQNTVKIVEMFM